MLYYASANRDEDVFEEPDRFRIDRHPNPHLGFGIGEHFCLGANLARKSQRALFAELVRAPRARRARRGGRSASPRASSRA